MTYLTLKTGTRARFYIILMEDLMNTTEAGSLYVLICSLIGTVISILAVWHFTAAAYAAPGLVA